jgi:hypothetical protein
MATNDKALSTPPRYSSVEAVKDDEKYEQFSYVNENRLLFSHFLRFFSFNLFQMKREKESDDYGRWF